MQAPVAGFRNQFSADPTSLTTDRVPNVPGARRFTQARGAQMRQVEDALRMGDFNRMASGIPGFPTMPSRSAGAGSTLGSFGPSGPQLSPDADTPLGQEMLSRLKSDANNPIYGGVPEQSGRSSQGMSTADFLRSLGIFGAQTFQNVMPQQQRFDPYAQFQQQRQSPFQGGYGGGFGTMFGGIGGLGFSPMMGPQFGRQMRGFSPYQQRFQPQQFVEGNYPQVGTPPMMDMRYRGGGPEMSPEMLQRRENDMRNMERMATQGLPQNKNQFENMVRNLGLDRQEPVMSPHSGNMGARQSTMFSGLGGLGLNPMMGTQIGMQLTPEQKYQQAQQYGNQQYLSRPEVRSANEEYSRALEAAALASRG